MDIVITEHDAFVFFFVIVSLVRLRSVFKFFFQSYTK